MKRLLLGSIVVAICLLTMPSSTVVSAQQPAATFPVIVVFDYNAPFHNFQAFYRADDRARANPAAWGYLDPGVAGAVQAIEASYGFRAAHVYSAALRGFAARLTARQIDALENEPTVAYVEADGTMSTNAQTLPWGINRIDADISSTLARSRSGSVNNV